ncbi:MAG: response regulator [Proteobacteria bacterium]|nr:response regulator [Pseudomonadota bacterium]MBU1686586.1 response regulator [Pseudomonadota bacterium]
MTSHFDTRSMTILVVDDEKISRLIIAQILEAEGFLLVEASSGEECIEKAINGQPDIILLDISMPGMSGIEVCRILLAEQRTMQIPIIFVTGSPSDQVLQQAFEAGCSDYIGKPVERIELLVRVKSALYQKVLLQKNFEREKLTGVLELAGAVCHELNQPLHAVMGYSDILLRNTSEKDPNYRYIRTINEQIERMGKITAQLMNITRYKAKEYLGGSNIVDIAKSSSEGPLESQKIL